MPHNQPEEPIATPHDRAVQTTDAMQAWYDLFQVTTTAGLRMVEQGLCATTTMFDAYTRMLKVLLEYALRMGQVTVSAWQISPLRQPAVPVHQFTFSPPAQPPVQLPPVEQPLNRTHPTNGTAEHAAESAVPVIELPVIEESPALAELTPALPLPITVEPLTADAPAALHPLASLGEAEETAETAETVEVELAEPSALLAVELNASVEDAPAVSEPTRREDTLRVGPEASFYFRGSAGQDSLIADSVTSFWRQSAIVDDTTWCYHLQRGDYSNWVRHILQDDDLATAVAELEQEEHLAPAESRTRLRTLIEQRYVVD